MKFLFVRPSEHSLHGDQLDQSFRLRHRILNEKFGWNLPHQNGRETDKFDQKSYFFLAVDYDGAIVGAWRAMPTKSGEFFNRSAFPQFFEANDTVKPADDVWDFSRFVIDLDRYGDDRSTLGLIGCGLACAIFEFMITHGITTYLAVQDERMTGYANQWFGRPSFQSLPIEISGSKVGLFAYQPSTERLYAMRAFFDIPAPALAPFLLLAAPTFSSTGAAA